jgi:hypothetical protein
MKSSVLFAAVIAAAVVAFSGCGSSKFGQPLTISEPTSIADILADPAKYRGQRVMVEGTITDVCKEMGCWIMIEDGGGKDALRFKVEDGVIEFPADVMGKKARAEGVVSVKEMSVEDQLTEGQHMAEEAGRKFDPSTVTGPKTRIQINGEGAVVE